MAKTAAQLTSQLATLRKAVETITYRPAVNILQLSHTTALMLLPTRPVSLEEEHYLCDRMRELHEQMDAVQKSCTRPSMLPTFRLSAQTESRVAVDIENEWVYSPDGEPLCSTSAYLEHYERFRLWHYGSEPLDAVLQREGLVEPPDGAVLRDPDEVKSAMDPDR